MNPNDVVPGNPGIVDPVDENTIYYCYPKEGTTSETQKTWAILRMKLRGTAWYYEWAGGTMDHQFAAKDRATLPYSWLKM